MKLKRSERMVVISNYLINNPYKLTSLNTFAERMKLLSRQSQKMLLLLKKLLKKVK